MSYQGGRGTGIRSARGRHDRWSIFGPTYPGVPPSQVVPYQVPQAYPRFGIPNSAFWGVDGFGCLGSKIQGVKSAGCGPGRPCGSCRAAMAGFGGCSPCAGGLLPVGGSSAAEFRGLGEPILCSSTGSPYLDAGIGAVLGALAAPSSESRAFWAVGGAAAGGLTGLLGMGAVVFAGLLVDRGK